MNLWTVRNRSLQATTDQLAEETSAIERAFQQLEYLAQALEDSDDPGSFNWATAIITAKSRLLAQAIYSLMLDGLGQEAGALAARGRSAP